MTVDDRDRVRDRNPDRGTEAAMAALLTSAPPNLASDVLVEVGLADRYARMDSPIGPLTVVWNGVGVASVESVGAEGDAAFEEAHVMRTGRRIVRADALPERLASAIGRRLDGDRHVRIDLDLRRHTAFERDVWSKALEIPRGEVRPYGWIAAEIGRPKAVRAVGSALAHNPVPLVVPCHRVVRSDGMIGEYSLGGPPAKRAVLSSEGLDPDELERLARGGIRYLASATTGIYCLPTCHNARRITHGHRVPFGSAAASEAAGYRACRECRPGAAG